MEGYEFLRQEALKMYLTNMTKKITAKKRTSSPATTKKRASTTKGEDLLIRGARARGIMLGSREGSRK
jgi:hypothetical protein